MRTNKPIDAPPAAKKLRRYDEAYLQFGFTVTADLRPQCVVCAEVLANDSMKPCKLKRHLETKHAGIKNKPAEYFKRKLDGLHQQQATISVHSTVSVPEATLFASGFATVRTLLLIALRFAPYFCFFLRSL